MVAGVDMGMNMLAGLEAPERGACVSTFAQHNLAGFVVVVADFVAVIEGFRSCLLGTPFEWLYILPGLATSVLLFFSGAMYFRRMERVFVDVI